MNRSKPIYMILCAGIIQLFLAGCPAKTTFSGSNSGQAKLPEALATPPVVITVTLDPYEKITPPPGPARNVITREFVLGSKEHKELKINLASDEIQNKITLMSDTSTAHKVFTQPKRSEFIDHFNQVPASTIATDEILAKDISLLDILVVVDNSISMSQAQANFGARLEPLLSAVRNRNWQIAVTTTDPRDVIRGIFKAENAKTTAQFAAMKAQFSNLVIGFGTSGSNDELGIKQAYDGIDGVTVRGPNGEVSRTTPWIRSGSSIAVLIVSDEDNCSSGQWSSDSPWCYDLPNKTRRPWTSTNYLRDHLASKRKLVDNARVYGIIFRAADKNTTCDKGLQHVSADYEKLILETGGFVGSICEADYTTTLSDISKSFATFASKAFELNNTPAAGSNPVVKINNVVQDSSKYTLVGRILTFHSAPSTDAKVTVEYTLEKRTPLKAFTLSRSPFKGTERVIVNNIVKTTGFTVNDTSLVFTEVPPPLATIDVAYQENMPLPSKFTIDTNIRTETLKVSVGDRPRTDFTYNSSTGELSFGSNPPAEGLLIKVAYQLSSTPQLTYKLGAPAGITLASSEVTDATSGKVVPAILDLGSDTLSISAQDFVEGRVLLVKMHAKLWNGQNFTLPTNPIANSSTLTGDNLSCKEPEDLSVTGSIVTPLSGRCNVGNTGSVTLGWDQGTPVGNEFVLGNIADLDSYIWEVKINGINVAFTRNGSRFVLSSTPAALSTVKIIGTPQG